MLALRLSKVPRLLALRANSSIACPHVATKPIWGNAYLSSKVDNQVEYHANKRLRSIYLGFSL